MRRFRVLALVLGLAIAPALTPVAAAAPRATAQAVDWRGPNGGPGRWHGGNPGIRDHRFGPYGGPGRWHGGNPGIRDHRFGPYGARPHGYGGFVVPPGRGFSLGFGFGTGVPMAQKPVYPRVWPHYVWVPGGWIWQGSGVVWVPGHWRLVY